MKIGHVRAGQARQSCCAASVEHTQKDKRGEKRHHSKQNMKAAEWKGETRMPPRDLNSRSGPSMRRAKEGGGGAKRQSARIWPRKERNCNGRGAIARGEPGRMKRTMAREGRERDSLREHERTGEEGEDRAREGRASKAELLCRISRTHTKRQTSGETAPQQAGSQMASDARTRRRKGGHATDPQRLMQKMGWSDGSENRGEGRDNTKQLESTNL